MSRSVRNLRVDELVARVEPRSRNVINPRENAGAATNRLRRWKLKPSVEGVLILIGKPHDGRSAVVVLIPIGKKDLVADMYGAGWVSQRDRSDVRPLPAGARYF